MKTRQGRSRGLGETSEQRSSPGASRPRRSADERSRSAPESEAVLLTDDVRLAEAVSVACSAASVGLRVLGAEAALPVLGPGTALLLGADVSEAKASAAHSQLRRGELRSVCEAPADRQVLVAALSGGEGAAYALAQAAGGAAVVRLPEATAWLASRLAAGSSRADAGRVIGLISAAGGAGCTTLAALSALSAAASDPGSVLLMAGEPWACGIADALSLDPVSAGTHREGIGWGDLGQVKGVLNPAEFQRALPEADGVRFLLPEEGVPELPPARARAAVADAARSAFPLTVVDIGQGYRCSDSLLGECDELLMLIPSTVRSVESARMLAGLLEGSGTGGLRAVVMGTGQHGAPPAERIAELAQIPFGAAVRWDKRIRAADAAGALPTQVRSRAYAEAIALVSGSGKAAA